VLEYGLIVLWEMFENQPSYLEGRESEVLALLFRLRFANKQNVSYPRYIYYWDDFTPALQVAEATNTIRDAMATRTDPVYGLKTVTTSLKRFLTQPVPSGGSPEARSLAYAFGLLAIGKFLLRLPADILEEELPRMKSTLTEARFSSPAIFSISDYRSRL
jgi:CLIP-associating protein 1/2